MSKPPGYSHVVEASAPGRIVYIAGQLGVDREGKVVGDFRQQAIQTFENLKAALAAVGAGFRQVVKLNNYLVDVRDLPTFREVRDSYFPPATGRRARPSRSRSRAPGCAARDRGGGDAARGGQIGVEGRIQARRRKPRRRAATKASRSRRR